MRASVSGNDCSRVHDTLIIISPETNSIFPSVFNVSRCASSRLTCTVSIPESISSSHLSPYYESLSPRARPLPRPAPILDPSQHAGPPAASSRRRSSSLRPMGGRLLRHARTWSSHQHRRQPSQTARRSGSSRLGFRHIPLHLWRRRRVRGVSPSSKRSHSEQHAFLRSTGSS